MIRPRFLVMTKILVTLPLFLLGIIYNAKGQLAYNAQDSASNPGLHLREAGVNMQWAIGLDLLAPSVGAGIYLLEPNKPTFAICASGGIFVLALTQHISAAYHLKKAGEIMSQRQEQHLSFGPQRYGFGVAYRF